MITITSRHILLSALPALAWINDLSDQAWTGGGRTDRLFAPVGTFSTFRTVNNPSVTRPKTQCFPSRNSAGAQVMKNCVCTEVRRQSRTGLSQASRTGWELAWIRRKLT